MDRQTLAFYDTEPERYATATPGPDDEMPPWLARFAENVTPGGRVLDFGAGHGWAAAALAARGFAVEATDASEGLAALGRQRYGLEIRVEPFEALTAVSAYDGIWASFCLLHAARAELPEHMARLATALRPGGLLYVGMKAGDGAARDSLGRQYTYVSGAELTDLLEAAGLCEVTVSEDSLVGCTGAVETGLHAYARKPMPETP